MERNERGRRVVDWLIFARELPNQRALAELIDYNPTVLSSALSGRIRLSDKLARNLVMLDDRLNLNWLLYEEGEMLLPEEEKKSSRKVMSSATGTLPAGKGVPYYSQLPATGGANEQFDYDESAELWYIPGVQADAYFPVTGHSMEPYIMDGDVVGVKSIQLYDRMNPDDTYLIITREDMRMIKHIIPTLDDEETLTLLSNNPAYPPYRIAKTDILKVMKVVFSGRLYR